jgi:hypothetical protein
MLVKSATTRDCERLFRRDLERRGHRFDHYKRKWQRPKAVLSFVQAQSNFTLSTVASISATISTTGGNLLVAWCHGNSNNSVITISDSAAQTWTAVSSGSVSSAGTNNAEMFYMPNSAAVTSVTANFATSESGGIIVFEISGAATTSPSDGSVNSSATGSFPSAISGSLTTTNANDILIMAVNNRTSQTTWTPGTGYIIPANGSETRGAMQYQIVSLVQTGVTATMSWGTTALGYATTFAAFQAAVVAVVGFEDDNFSMTPCVGYDQTVDLW